jgi:cleavage stimulation factor subunit 3
LWVRYIDAEMSAGNADAAVRAAFARCLSGCRSVELWSLYVRFMRKANELRGADGVAEVRAAYECALDHVGQCIQSGPLWQDCANFLAGARPGTPAYAALWTQGMVGGGEEAARAAALRCVLRAHFGGARGR